MGPLNQLMNSIHQQVYKKYEATRYTDSYVAFLDILGMKNLLNKKYEEIRSVFNTIEQSILLYEMMKLPNGEPFLSPSQMKLTVMSDSIVLSIDRNVEQSFSKIIGISSYIIKNLIDVLDEPVFVRGAISVGEIYQDGFSVFGPGLSKAYILENNVASSMRCIISNEIYVEKEFCDYIGKNNSLICDKCDSLYFINFINDKNKGKIVDYAHTLISSDLDERIKIKYRWLLNHIGT